MASRPQALAVAAAVVIAALLAAWAEWQPQRSVDAAGSALALIGRNPAGALSSAHAAVARDPLSAEALITLAAVQQGAGQGAAAKRTYQRAVHLQPSNWQTWEALGEYELRVGEPRAALNALRAAVYLNPQAILAPRADLNEELLALQNDYLQALRDTSAGGGTTASSSASRPGTAGSAKSTASAGAGTAASLKSARVAHSPASRGALPALHRSRALRPPGSRSPRAA